MRTPLFSLVFLIILSFSSSFARLKSRSVKKDSFSVGGSLCYDITQNPALVQGINKLVPNFQTFATNLINSKLPIIVNDGGKVWEENIDIGFPIFCTLNIGVDTVQIQSLNIDFTLTSGRLTNNVTSNQIAVDITLSAFQVSFRGYGNCGPFHPLVPGTLRLSGVVTVVFSECFNSSFFLQPSTDILNYLNLSAESASFSITKFDFQYTVQEDNPIVKAVINKEIGDHVGDIQNAIVSGVQQDVAPLVNKELVSAGIKPFSKWQSRMQSKAHSPFRISSNY